MKTLIRAALALLALSVAAMGVTAANSGTEGPVIYVTSQDLVYDSIVLTSLPMQGPFQQLIPGGPADLMTEWGPGDKAYVGGRWWLDANGNGMMDSGDLYFSCPLLGPGRDNP